MKFKQKGAESAFLLNMTVRTQEGPVPLSEYGDGTPGFRERREFSLPGFHFDPFPVCVSCRIRFRMKFGALPLSGRMIRLSRTACYAADISGRWRCDRFRICGRSVFGTIDGAVRVRYIRQEPFFIMFSGANLLRGSCDMLLQGIIFIDF